MSELLKDGGVVASGLGRTLARYIRFVRKTTKWTPDIGDLEALRIEAVLTAQQPFIFAMWHGQFMLMPLMYVKGIPVLAMIARHGDTAVLSAMLQTFGMDLIRGAGAGGRKKDRGGATAFRAAQSALTTGGTSVAMTADVPPGPARRAGMGIVTLARTSGRPIIPVAIASKRKVSFDTWSKFTINLPWTSCGIAIGDPIFVPATASNEEQERLRQLVEASLNETTRLAYERANGIDPMTRHRADRRSPALALYRGLTNAAGPLAPTLLARRAAAGKEDSTRAGERKGVATVPRPAGTLAWFHAASVGETVAVLPMLKALKQRRPALNLLLTTGTVTSAQVAAERLGGIATHQYVPLDVPGFVTRFLDHWQPDLGVFIESELWPNLLLAAKARGMPLALVNARMSERSVNGWKNRKTMAAKVLGSFDLVLAQTEGLGRRLSRLGAHNVSPAGNLKVDSPAPPVDRRALAALQHAIGPRLCFLAASTHPGEEEIIVQARATLARAMPKPLAIIVPRHPARGADLATMIADTGATVSRRTSQLLPSEDDDVFLADTMGELGTFFAATPVAFIGGSLVKIGGHNPIEAIKLGAGVITGPYRHNFDDVYEPLLKDEACREVRDEAQLAAALGDLIGGGATLEAMTKRAKGTLERMSGALDRTLVALEAMLDAPPKSGRQERPPDAP
jgi:3-deoxy-D-manno-octulosonic-acid transferase